MKLINFTAVLLLTGISLVRAQEMVPTPEPMATPAETPAATPESAATATQTPSAEIKTESAASESPAATATPKAPPAPKPKQTTARKGSVESQLKDMENRWAAAVKNRDGATIKEILAEDYVGLSSKGEYRSKRREISEVTKSKDTFKSTSDSRVKVRVVSKNVAVVTGDYREVGTDKAGKKIDRTYRWIDTWVDRGGKWQCVASSVMLIRGG